MSETRTEERAWNVYANTKAKRIFQQIKRNVDYLVVKFSSDFIASSLLRNHSTLTASVNLIERGV
jgi:hypothetical protein